MRNILFFFIISFQLTIGQEVNFEFEKNSKKIFSNENSEMNLTLTFSENKILNIKSNHKVKLKGEYENLIRIEFEYLDKKYFIAEKNKSEINKTLKNLISDEIEKIIKLGKLKINVDTYPFSNPKSIELLKSINYENSIIKNDFGIIYINNSWMFIIPEFNVKNEVNYFTEIEKNFLCNCVTKELKKYDFNDINYNNAFHNCLDSKLDNIIMKMYNSYSSYFTEEELIENEKNEIFNSEVKLFMKTLNDFLIINCLKQ